MNSKNHVSRHTIHWIRQFAQPAVNAGVIDGGEFDEAMQMLEEQVGDGPRLEARGVAAARLGCHPKTVSRMIHCGILRAVELIPGNVKSSRVRADDVDRVIKGHHE